MLRNTCSKKRAFVCIHEPAEWGAEHWGELLNSVNELLQQSPGTRIFVTGRPHILPELGKRLARRVMSVVVGKSGVHAGYLTTTTDKL